MGRSDNRRVAVNLKALIGLGLMKKATVVYLSKHKDTKAPFVKGEARARNKMQKASRKANRDN